MSHVKKQKKQVTQILTFLSLLFFLRKKDVQKLIIVAQICQAFYNKDAKLVDELLRSIPNITQRISPGICDLYQSRRFAAHVPFHTNFLLKSQIRQRFILVKIQLNQLFTPNQYFWILNCGIDNSNKLGWKKVFWCSFFCCLQLLACVK